MVSNKWPLVSVIMPAYNHERFVEAAVRSVWALEYRPVELIVLNDGSSDGTLQVLRSLEAKSPIEMRVIDKPNEGICKTLNRGIALARGKYLGFLASDDEYTPDRMTRHVQFLESCDDPLVVGCYGQQSIMDEAGHLVTPVVRRKMLYDNPLHALLSLKSPFYLQGSTFKREVVVELGFDESLFYEDWDFLLRLHLKYRLAYLPGVAFRYRGHAHGTNRAMQRMAAARLQIFDKHRNNPAVQVFGVGKFRSHIEVANAQGYFLVGDFHEAKTCFTRSIQSWPPQIIYAFPLGVKLLMGKKLVNVARRIKRLVGI